MSAIFFLNEYGKPLLSRNFKGDVPLSCINYFPTLLHLYENCPCFEHLGVHYLYIRHADLIILCVSATSFSNAMSIMHFLYKIVECFESFVKNVEAESVIDNFVVLYELLDEMMDFGIVQTTDGNLLKDYVTQSSYKLEVSQAVSALTDKVSWRPSGIWYKKNELFVDVVESITIQQTPQLKESSKLSETESNGLNISQPAEAHVSILGTIRIRSFLSGMPKLTLALNDIPSLKGLSYHRASRHVVLSDVVFHQCVDLEVYERDHRVEFVPPDGSFDLLTYRIKNRSHAQGGDVAMFSVLPKIQIKKNSRVHISCKIKAQYRRRQHAKKLELFFPVPPYCDSPRYKTSKGSAVYVPEDQKVVWRLPNFAGGEEATMQAELNLGNVDENTHNEDVAQLNATPVSLSFEMPGFVYSGLHIKYLKIKEDNLTYQALPWVRYLAKSGEYTVRHS